MERGLGLEGCFFFLLNPVVPVQGTCLCCRKMCVVVLNAGRRRATRHWRDWQTEIV